MGIDSAPVQRRVRASAPPSLLIVLFTTRASNYAFA
jgi:hypothetical protein